MIREYTISNFKAFSTPATLPIKPITLIYGENSAGKSSLFQSMMVLKQNTDPLFLEEESDTEDVINTPIARLIHNHDVKSTFEFKLIFDIDEIDKHYFQLKTPKKMQNLIKMIKEKYDCFGLSHAFILNEDAEKELRNHESDYLNWDSHKLNLYIGLFSKKFC